MPPDVQLEVIREIVRHNDHIRGVLAQKPLGVNYAEAVEVVRLCEEAGITLAVNQNMRYDQSVRACKCLLDRGYLGTPVFATIDMRAIPHWMPWQQRLGWVTLRIMSIHHLDTFRYWFGDPVRVFASVREDPRTARKFPHEDGICLYILEYDNGCARRPGTMSGRGRPWRAPEGHLDPLARGRNRRPGPRHHRLARLPASHAQHAGFHDHASAGLLAAAAVARSLVSRCLCRHDGPVAVRVGGPHRAGDQRPGQSEDDGPGRSLLRFGPRASGGRDSRNRAAWRAVIRPRLSRPPLSSPREC